MHVDPEILVVENGVDRLVQHVESIRVVESSRRGFDEDASFDLTLPRAKQNPGVESLAEVGVWREWG